MTLRTDPELAGASNAKLRPYFVLSVAAALTCILALETGCNSLGIAVAQVLSTHEGDSLVYVAVEEMPQPVGGLGALASQVKIPATAWTAGVEGKCFWTLSLMSRAAWPMPEYFAGSRQVLMKKSCA